MSDNITEFPYIIFELDSNIHVSAQLLCDTDLERYVGTLCAVLSGNASSDTQFLVDWARVSPANEKTIACMVVYMCIEYGVRFGVDVARERLLKKNDVEHALCVYKNEPNVQTKAATKLEYPGTNCVFMKFYSSSVLRPLLARNKKHRHLILRRAARLVYLINHRKRWLTMQYKNKSPACFEPKTRSKIFALCPRLNALLDQYKINPNAPEIAKSPIVAELKNYIVNHSIHQLQFNVSDNKKRARVAFELFGITTDVK